MDKALSSSHRDKGRLETETGDIGKLIGSALGGQGQGDSPVAKVMSLLGGQGGGGVTKLLSSLQSGPLAGAVQSWIGKGSNQPVSGEQVTNALGQDQISQIAQQSGMSEGDVANHLAEHLPAAVDHLSPEGTLPDAGGLQDLLGRFLGK